MCVCVSAAEGFSKAGNGCGCGVQALNIEGMFGPVCVYVGVGCLRLIPKLKMDMDVGLKL